MKLQASLSSRRGAVAPLVALLMIVILGMVAFSVDMGYIVVVRQELQNAADSAALAGASQLADLEFKANFASAGSVPTLVNTSSANAKAEAAKFAAANQGGGVNLTLLDADITLGHLSQPSGSSSIQPVSVPSVLPNTVSVVVRRDSTVTTGSLKLFFAPVLGKKTQDLSASASATFQSGAITGFSQPKQSERSLLLPIALDVNAWTALLNNTTMPSGYGRQDAYTVTSPTNNSAPPNNVSKFADGIPELKGIYPNDNAPGNFGLVDIGPDANNAPTFWEWITNGPSAADLQYLAQNRNGVAGSADWQATPTNPATLKCGPGLKASDERYLQDIIGQTRIMPLFSSCQGNGQNATYTIVGFASMTILEAELNGNSKHITIQPVPAIDTTAVFGTAQNSITRFISRPLALTR